jgi:hypothetical protein
MKRSNSKRRCLPLISLLNYLLQRVSDGRLEVSTTEWVTETPLVEDPYEKRTVMVKTSRMPGADEGLFAARYVLFRDTAFHSQRSKFRKKDLPKFQSKIFLFQGTLRSIFFTRIASKMLGITFPPLFVKIILGSYLT